MKTPVRIGYGYDLHRFVEGRPFILGGIIIPHTHGLLGHSDADGLSHAIADALLGAAGLYDIGHYFPDTDDAYKDFDSQEILRQVALKLDELELIILNIDATVVTEKPKLGPYIDSMKQVIGTSLKICPKKIGIKATTHEGIGEIGKNEALAAHAVCLLGLKEKN